MPHASPYCPYCGFSQSVCFGLSTCEQLRKHPCPRAMSTPLNPLLPLHLFGFDFLPQSEIPMGTRLGTPYKRSVWASSDKSRYLIQDDYYGTLLLSYLVRVSQTWFLVQTPSLDHLRSNLTATPLLLLNPSLTEEGLLDVHHLSLN